MKYTVEFDEEEDVDLGQYAKTANATPEEFIKIVVLARVKPERVSHVPVLNTSSGATE